MKNVTKFDELAALMSEAGPGGSYYSAPAPVNTTTAPTTFASKLVAGAQAPVAAAARGVGNFVKGSLTDPHGMAASIRSARTSGINQLLTSALDAVKDAYSKIRDQQLLNYYNKLDFPAGPPKKGSKFSIQTTDGKTYIGTVQSVSTIGAMQVFTIPTSEKGASFTGSAPRIYTIEMDPKTRAYFCIRKVTVSDLGTNPAGASPGAGTTVPGGKNIGASTYVKNEKESGLASHFVAKYDTGSQSFILELNKTYTCNIAITPANQGMAIGSKITGPDLVTGRNVTGIVVGTTVISPTGGTPINVYVVNANLTP